MSDEWWNNIEHRLELRQTRQENEVLLTHLQNSDPAGIKELFVRPSYLPSYQEDIFSPAIEDLGRTMPSLETLHLDVNGRDLRSSSIRALKRMKMLKHFVISSNCLLHVLMEILDAVLSSNKTLQSLVILRRSEHSLPFSWSEKVL